MTITAFPLDAVSSAPTYTGEMLRQTLSALMGPVPAGRPLGAYSGVRPGTPNTTVTASSSTWTIGVHSGVVDVETAATAGPYLYAVRVAETGAMTPASAANDRIDLLSLVLDDPAEGDGSSTPQVRSVLTIGTPAASPTPPAAPARSLVLAQIRVPKTGTGSPVVTWVAPEYGARSFQATQTTVSNIASSGSTWVTIPLDTVIYNPGQWTLGSSGLVIPAAGVYRVSGLACIAGNSTGLRGARITVGSTAVDGTSVQNPNAGGSTRMQMPTGVGFAQCAAGDGVFLQALQNSGVTLPTGAGSSLVVERVG